MSNCLNFALPRDVFCFGLNFVSLPSRKFCFLFSFAKNVCILKNKAYRLEIFLRLFFKSFYHTTKSDPTGKLPFEKTGSRTFFAPLNSSTLISGIKARACSVEGDNLSSARVEIVARREKSIKQGWEKENKIKGKWGGRPNRTKSSITISKGLSKRANKQCLHFLKSFTDSKVNKNRSEISEIL